MSEEWKHRKDTVALAVSGRQSAGISTVSWFGMLYPRLMVECKVLSMVLCAVVGASHHPQETPQSPEVS